VKDQPSREEQRPCELSQPDKQIEKDNPERASDAG